MRIPSGKIDQYVYFVAVDSVDLKTKKTGLTGFTVLRERNGLNRAFYTTPTIVELDSVNCPGLYRLLVDEDTTIAAASDAEEYVVHINVAGMAPVIRVIELFRRDTTSGRTQLVDANGRVDVSAIAGTAQTARDIGASVLLSSGTGTGQVSLTAGVVAANATQIAGAAVNTATAQLGVNVVSAAGTAWNSGAITPNTLAAGALTAAKFAANALDAVWSTATRILTAGTNIPTLDAAATRAAIGLASANLDTQLLGISSKTANLPPDPADASDIAGAFGTVNANVGTVNGTVNAIKVKTDNIPAAPAAVGDIPTANENADALLDRAAGVEPGMTVRQGFRLWSASLLGKAIGMSTSIATFRDTNDTKDRIVATVDASGNRSSVTLDPS